ncbi:unnamed protein product [Pleuronectes platessa]|uniref:Uncharacterized protein n=1 Tax=Pleuronectes platessa TaxID=8262 RepID=A0A9N7VA28_PLEPL|nr:unnamed protein product [Pleuronectes platessa]
MRRKNTSALPPPPLLTEDELKRQQRQSAGRGSSGITNTTTSTSSGNSNSSTRPRTTGINSIANGLAVAWLANEAPAAETAEGKRQYYAPLPLSRIRHRTSNLSGGEELITVPTLPQRTS